MTHQDLIFTNDVASHIDALIEKFNPSKLFILVDHNTRKHVLPQLAE